LLSQTTEYALRAIIHLARTNDDDPVRVDDVAEALGVPRNYLSKILHVLARDGVLASTRGPGGGFRLARAPETLRLVDVIGEFEVPEAPGDCLLGRTRCPDEATCPAHERWTTVSSTIADFFEKTTVADLATPARPTAQRTPGPDPPVETPAAAPDRPRTRPPRHGRTS
jgi:Rrf2 family protein